MRSIRKMSAKFAGHYVRKNSHKEIYFADFEAINKLLLLDNIFLICFAREIVDKFERN